MSYYCNPKNICPGPIEGSPLTGLNHRVAVCVQRVLDSCQKQIANRNVALHLSGVSPRSVPPLRLVEATSTGYEASVTDLQVDRLSERPAFARVRCKVTIPLHVSYKDANGQGDFADSVITVPQDVVMFAPRASVFPFRVVAVASANCVPDANATGGTDPAVVVGTACVTIVMKVVADTDILIPAYGFCPAPKCVDYQERICEEFFDLPLYPSGK